MSTVEILILVATLLVLDWFDWRSDLRKLQSRIDALEVAIKEMEK